MERDRRVPYLVDEVEALRLIMAVSERAGFEFVVTDASISEVDALGVTGTPAPRQGTLSRATTSAVVLRATKSLLRTSGHPPIRLNGYGPRDRTLLAWLVRVSGSAGEGHRDAPDHADPKWLRQADHRDDVRRGVRDWALRVGPRRTG